MFIIAISLLSFTPTLTTILAGICFLWGKGGLKLLEKMHDAQLNLFQTYGTNSYLKKKSNCLSEVQSELGFLKYNLLILATLGWKLGSVFILLCFDLCIFPSPITWSNNQALSISLSQGFLQDILSLLKLYEKIIHDV